MEARSKPPRPLPPVDKVPPHEPDGPSRPYFTAALRGNEPFVWPLPEPSAEDSRRIDEALDLLRRIPFEELQRRGWHLQPASFYNALNDVGFLEANPDLWHDRGVPRDIDWRIDDQLALVRELDGYLDELADVPVIPREGVVEYVWENNAFGSADAVAYYGLVRKLRPRRVVEIGSGWSSLLLARAVAANGSATGVTLIEPEPNERLFSALPPEWTVREEILQRVELELFASLQAGDVLFYDGSHCCRTASDVVWFFFEVLPRVPAGVWIHFHDILLPDDYFDRWILDEGLSWNEQYLLRAFLMNNPRYAVRIASHLLWSTRRAEIEALHGGDGVSVWLEKLPERRRLFGR